MKFNIKNYIRYFTSVVLVLTIIASVIVTSIVSTVSANSGISSEHSFETGNKTDYIHQVQTNNYSQEQKYSAEISAEYASHGEKSLYFSTTTGAAKGQYIFFKEGKIKPEAGKWFNFKIYVPQVGDLDRISLFYRLTNGTVKTSSAYYFRDNENNTVPADSIRETGKWITISFQVAAGENIQRCGLYISSFAEKNENVKFYIDEFSITDKALDTLRYPDMNDPAIRGSFEGGTEKDYIDKVQTNTWGQETKYVASLSKEQADNGAKSLKISTVDGAAKAQLFFLKTDFFKPETGKWYNLKVFVPEESGAAVLALFYKRNDGNIKYSDNYYFENNSTNSVVTDEIRQKGQWITLSLQIPSNVTIQNIGIYATSFATSNNNALFYVDSYSVTDTALDTIRYLDMNDPAVKHSFEAGTKDDYIQTVQTNTFSEEKKYSANITTEQKSEGKKSLKISTVDGAAKSQLFFLKADFFKPEAGKWYNLKVFVPEESGTTILSLFYKQKDGNIKYSDNYYFENNSANSVVTDEIRQKGQWVTLSLFVPKNAEIVSGGVYASSFEEYNNNANFYIDSYSLTDTALDTIRYLNLDDPNVRLNFETGTKENYIQQVQTNDYKEEKKYSAVIVGDNKADGNKSLFFKTGVGAAKGQFIFLNNDYFLPKAGQWVNLKVFMTEDSTSDILAFFYRKQDGNMVYSDYYYFSDNANNPVMTDEIRHKNEWVSISYKIPNGVKLKNIGIYISSFNEKNEGAKFYIDSYSIADSPIDMIRYNNNSISANGMLLDFESGAASDYLYIVQDQQYHQAKGMTSAVTSFRAADGKRSLYLKNTRSDTSSIYVYFPEKYNPKTGRFLNVKVFVDADNKGLDYARLIYRDSTGTISQGPTFSFANNAKGTIAQENIYKKGQWVTMSVYIPQNTDLTRAGIIFGSYGNNGNDKSIFIDSYCYSNEPLDKTKSYYIKPVIEIPKNYTSGINRVQLTSNSLFYGINLITPEYLNTNLGSIKAMNISLEVQEIKEGSVFDKALAFAQSKEFVLYNLAMYNEKKEISLKEKIKISFTIPDNIDLKTTKVYYVDKDGVVTEIEANKNFEFVTIETDKLGYFMVAGNKAETVKLTFLKSNVKFENVQFEKLETPGTLLWWPWLLGGVLFAVAASLAVILYLKKRAKAK